MPLEGRAGGRCSLAPCLIYISNNSHDSIHMFLHFRALCIVKVNKTNTLLPFNNQWLFALQVNWYQSALIGDHNNYCLKTIIILGAICGCKNNSKE